MLGSVLSIISISSAVLIVLKLTGSLFNDLEEQEESNTPFECGIDVQEKSRTPIHLHFFSISILFLVFDIEVIILFPLVSASGKVNSLFWLTLFVVLLLGLAIEILFGSIDWKEF